LKVLNFAGAFSSLISFSSSFLPEATNFTKSNYEKNE
jgi:hypothetical protein